MEVKNDLRAEEQAVQAAREKLMDMTPLPGDCGVFCGGACCRSADGEETGMLLFPGERAAYEGLPGWRIAQGALGEVVFCPGTCNRAIRPLSCRMFPLLPVLREGTIRVTMDQRGRAVCPLVGSGVRGVQEAFRQAVREAGGLLAQAEGTRQILEKLTWEQDELKALRSQLGGL